MHSRSVFCYNHIMQNLKGSQLKKIREERAIPLEQVASETRIRLSILHDLEDDAYSELSSSTQTKGFLRLYAQYLGIDPDEPEPIIPAETDTPQLTEPTSSHQPEPALLPAPQPEAVKPVPLASEPPAPALQEPAPKSESGKILADIGRELSARRRYLNIGWDIIQEQTLIPKAQIQSLEQGDLNAMSNPLQFKGLLQTYARFLNLDLESVMLRYAEALQKRRAEISSPKRRPRKPGKVLPPFLVTLKRFFTLDLFFGTLLILGILGFLIWGIARMSAVTRAPEANGTLPAVADVLLSEPTNQIPTDDDAASGSTQVLPTVTPFFTGIVSDEPIEIVILARQNVWLRVTSDGDLTFEGRMVDGEVRSFTAKEALELDTGNIIALEIVYNQNRLEPLSNRLGVAARIIFSAEGFQELPVTSPDIQVTPTP